MNYFRKKKKRSQRVYSVSALPSSFPTILFYFGFPQHTESVLFPYPFCSNYEKSFTMKITVIQKLENTALSLEILSGRILLLARQPPSLHILPSAPPPPTAHFHDCLFISGRGYLSVMDMASQSLGAQGLPVEVPWPPTYLLAKSISQSSPENRNNRMCVCDR